MVLEYTLKENSSRGGVADRLSICGQTAKCVDLRPWARANKYRFRLEESYRAESSRQVCGDGRWYVKILCRYGLIYPYGGEILLAYASRGVKRHIAALGPDIQHHQTDGDGEVFRFPVEKLNEVVAILQARRRRAIGASSEQLRAMRERRKALAQGGQTAQERTQGPQLRVRAG